MFEDADEPSEPSLNFGWAGREKVVEGQDDGDLRDLGGAKTRWFLEIQSQYRVC